MAIRSVQRTKGGKVFLFCIERGRILASYNTIDEKGRIGDPRDAGKEGEDGKCGGEPRILQCPLEEGEDGDWEIEDEDLEAGELVEI